MGTVRQSIDPPLEAWLGRQHMFFVATAPRDGAGHVNLSPKGLDTFRVLGPNRVAYLDLTGSGVETIAHLRENGRVTLMFCAFEGPPRIVRLYGRGLGAHERRIRSSTSWRTSSTGYPAGVRSSRSTSSAWRTRAATRCRCTSTRGPRERLLEWAVNKGPDGLATYWAEKNHASIDGLPGLPAAPVPAAAAEGLQ